MYIYLSLRSGVEGQISDYWQWLPASAGREEEQSRGKIKPLICLDIILLVNSEHIFHDLNDKILLKENARLSNFWQ